MSDLLRVLFDSNAVVDSLADPPKRYALVMDAVRSKRLDVLWTHITVDELAAIPDPHQRARLLTLAAGMARLVPTGAMVANYSRVDWARPAVDSEAIEAFRQGNLRHTRDALIAATAVYEGCCLVTSDRTLAKRAAARDIEVLSAVELAGRLQ